MIQQLLGSPVVFKFFDMRFREASSPRDTQLFLKHDLLPQSTLIF